MVVLTWVVWLGYYLAIFSVLLGAAWTVLLYSSGTGYIREWRRRPPGDEAAYLWAFMVPALNEAVTIADSVARLRAVDATNKIIIVINDGSDDNTGEVLEQIAGVDLIVHTRVAPNARKGKAAALDDAYQFLLHDLLSSERYGHWAPEQVIVGIVDADGRLATSAPARVGRHFDNPRVGGVQVNVRIYNRSSFLTRMQQLEFEVFGGLYQAGRSHWGAAFMGGNGQFNRLAALESVADEDGPWSHYLTEDQELGLRLLSRGWFGEQEAFTHVDQQGLNSLKQLYKQRTRWMQGNLQVVGSLRRLNAHHLLGIRRVDALISLLLPVLTLVVGVAVVSGLILWLGFGFPFLPLSNLWLTAVMVLLALGPASLGVLVLARGRGWAGLLTSLKVLAPYMVYVWLMWPVAFLGFYRLLRGQQGWVKTAREPLAK